MPKPRKSSKPRSSIRDEIVTTAGNRFTRWIQKNGQEIYRDRYGHFAKAATFRGAHSSIATKETIGTLRVRQISPDRIGPSPIQGDIAYTDKNGRWRAGRDVGDYRPDLKRGQFLKQADISELRSIRGAERNFFSFCALPAHRDKSRAQRVSEYQEFLKRISGLNLRSDAILVLIEFGWAY